MSAPASRLYSRPERISKCPVTGIPLDDRYDDASGSSCSEATSNSTWAPKTDSEAPSGTDDHVSSSPTNKADSNAGWVRQQVASYENAAKMRLSGSDSPDRLSAPTSPKVKKPKALWSFFKSAAPESTPETHIPSAEGVHASEDESPRALDMIIQEHQQLQAQSIQGGPVRQQRHNAPIGTRRHTQPANVGYLGRWLDSNIEATGLEKQEIHLTYLVLAQLFFDMLFHVICIAAAAVGPQNLRCHHHSGTSSTPCILMDAVLNFAVGPAVGNVEPPDRKIQIGSLIINEGNTGLFRALAWCVFNIAYYSAAACAIANTGSTFRRYKTFTIMCIAGIIGNALVLVEFRSALNVLIITFRLCIFWRAWAVRHTVRETLLLPRTPHDVLDSILGPTSRAQLSRS
eukprot:gnl/MRDRNA2_/MRDRNA2_134165_c0_seq1.p1 gnl/MRDRNA2_/MRDRNA2_134165_c0~~gnl/MRDRNA2_/MRDRNA2_134165_c0_seq1.p1  ORF type:complete len:401 (+),score=51.42 gnl/MRDRNA2_/MRDRNA2_134165_c0_seq1:161-1363(+)